MSFILDALRKSETDRQRESAPSLSRLPLASTRHRVPVWAWAFMAVLTVSVLLMGAAWWRSIQNAAAPAATPASRDLPPLVASEGAALPPAAASATGRTPDVAAGTGTDSIPANALGSGGSPAPTETTGVTVAEAQAQGTGQPAAASAQAATGSGQTAPLSRGADVNAALTPAAAAPNTSSASIPTLAQALARGISVPDLKLELHVYHSDPARRFVYINGKRYQQGQTIDGGPTVAEIRPEGAVLDQRGSRFLLLPQ